MSVGKIRNAALLAAVILASVACGLGEQEIPHDPGRAEQYRPTDAPTIVVEPLHGFDVHNRNALAGWADAVFVGQVGPELGTWNAETAPETQYLVRVVSRLKGNPHDEVIVNQLAGYRADGTLVIEEGDKLLDQGAWYVFSARVFEAKQCYTIAGGGVGAVELTDQEGRAVEEAPQGRETDEPDAVRQMREALDEPLPQPGSGQRAEPTTLPSYDDAPLPIPATSPPPPPG